MRKLWAALAATTTMFCLLLAVPALGHEGNPDFRSEINSVRPNVPGVSFEVLNYDADIELVAEDGHEVLIYGYEDEPYARVLARRDRAEEPALAGHLPERRSLRRSARCPEIADPKAPPDWKTVDKSGTFAGTTTACTTWRKGTAAPGQRREQEDQGLRLRDPDSRIDGTHRVRSRARCSGSARPTPRRRRSCSPASRSSCSAGRRSLIAPAASGGRRR